MSDELKLLAESAADLKIMSAVLQDAIIKVSDIHFNYDAATLTLVTSRFMHENSNGADGKRIRSGLRFNNVLSMKAKGINRSNPDAFLVLLSLTYAPKPEKPSGEVTLVFAGGGEICLQTELLEARLVDYLQSRPTKNRPLHPLNE